MQNACTSMNKSCTAAARQPGATALHAAVHTVDDLVANEALQEHAHQAHQPILHVLVLCALRQLRCKPFSDGHFPHAP